MSVLSRPQPTMPGFYAAQARLNHSARKKLNAFFQKITPNWSTLHFPSDWNGHPSVACWPAPSQSASVAARLPQSCTQSRAARMVRDCHKVITNDLLSGLTLSISEREMIYGLTGVSCWDSSGSRGASVIDSSGAEARPLSAGADALRTEMTPRHCLLPFMSC